jgi:hypothetical protein
VNLLHVCRDFATCLPHVCNIFAAALQHFCNIFAAILPQVCSKFVACLQQACRMFAAKLPRVCSKFAACLLLNLAYLPYPCVMCVQVVNIFRVAVLGGPQNQSLTRPNAHLQECGNDSVGAPDGRPRLIGDSYGFVVLREDAQCMAGGAQKWTSSITEGAMDLDQN